MKKSSTPISSWPLQPLFRYAILVFSLLSFSRLLLIIWQYPRVGSLDNTLTIMLLGLRFDVIVICVLWFIPMLFLLFLPRNATLNSLQSSATRYWLMLSTIIVLFMEISTAPFIDQYDTRPNRIFFEYLETPVEGVTSALYEYPWHFVAALVLLGLLIRYLIKFNRKIFFDLKPWPVWVRITILPLLLVFFVLGIRSSFGHRPANASIAAFSNDQLVNKLGLISMYTVLTAAYNLQYEDNAGSLYGEMAPEKMVALVRQQAFIDPASFVDVPGSTWHRQTAAALVKPKNLVIILEESLGAGFVGSLGGIGVTPEIDKLATEGLWFSHLYATGTRSARGIEAVISGFPPSPSRSVLKLGLAQQNFVTLASILKQNDYDTQFICGGESHFDNMAGFFLANGFDRVTDQNDYENPKFRGTWGVSDEDLLDRVDQELMRSSAKPKFILAFSSSNHVPFEFPDDTIELYDAEKNTVNNAVKYADYAVGQFFEKARTQPYWDNSLFLVVADHDDRVHGAALVPINKFHIPGLIIGPGIEARTNDKPASQIDLIPTLLNILGITSTHPLIGHNLRQLPVNFAGRAIMQYGNNYAYMSGNDVIILTPEKEPQQFSYENAELIQTPLDKELAEVARAHILWPMYAYRELKYLSQP